MSARATKLSINPVSQYHPPFWLVGCHAQTIWPSLLSPKARVVYRRERWDTADGDFVDVDFTDSQSSNVGSEIATTSPILVLFHGLEGSAQSSYSKALMAFCVRAGWQGAVAHFRGCSGEHNRLARAYHSGDSEHVDFVLNRLDREFNNVKFNQAKSNQNSPSFQRRPIFAVGVSLGGNALIKWLGTNGQNSTLIQGAYAISAPHDLEAGAVVLSKGFNKIYTNNFLKTLREKSRYKAALFPDQIKLAEILQARDFFTFDHVATAPLHGFRSCYDYWRRSSCKQFMAGITIPTTVLNALNDPFLPAFALATAAEVSPAVRLHYPNTGGHVGFAQGLPPGNQQWLAQQVSNFFETLISHG